MTREDAEVLKEAANVAALTGETQSIAEFYVRMYGEMGALQRINAERQTRAAARFHARQDPSQTQSQPFASVSTFQPVQSVFTPSPQPVPAHTPFPSPNYASPIGSFQSSTPPSQGWTPTYGPPPSASEIAAWTAVDGTKYCRACEEFVWDRLDEHRGKSVDRQEYVRVRNSEGAFSDGWVDLLIDGRHVVDFKSHDLSQWNEAKARQEGSAFGRQVRGYLDSPDLAGSGGEGYLFMVGKETANPDAMKALEEAAGAHGVKVVFVRGDGRLESVCDAVYHTFWNQR